MKLYFFLLFWNILIALPYNPILLGISLLKAFSLNWLNWVDSVIESLCLDVCLCVCAIGCSYFSRPLIGPEIIWSVPTLSLVLPRYPPPPSSFAPSLTPPQDKTRDIISNISLCLKEFPKAKPKGTPEGKGLYLILYPKSNPNTDILLF